MHPTPNGNVRVRVRTADPDAGREPAYRSYELPYTPRMTVNDALQYINEVIGDDVAYRYYCGVRKCGACAVRVNGREALACWEFVEPDLTIEPLRNLPLIRDLVIDRTAHEERVTRASPLLRRGAPHSGFPEPLSHEEMVNDAALECVSCLACVSACPVMADERSTFAGPAVAVQLAQVARDPRDAADRGASARALGPFPDCASCRKCEAACPVDIPIVDDAIEPLRRLAEEPGA